MPKHTKHHHKHKPTGHEKSPNVSIFIHNEVKQDGQHQEQKQRHEDESMQNSGCMAWIKSLCK